MLYPLYARWFRCLPLDEQGISPVEPPFYQFHHEQIGDHQSCQYGKEYDRRVYKPKDTADDREREDAGNEHDKE